MTLDYARRGPKGASRLVVFLHGYGANGADLLGLADVLIPHMPDTAFVAPDAPEASPNPGGFQWFPIPWIDGSSEEEAREGLDRSAADLDAFLDHVLAEEDLSEGEAVLFGFSQGTMMALHVAPRREDAFAGLVCFSGRLLEPEELAGAAISKPPVLLVHGDRDDVVPPASMPEAAEALGEAGFEVFGHVMKGTAHGIAPDGLEVALAFMRRSLALEEAVAPEDD
ncbi:phospholipase/carboxylesterase [Hasllibacter halocynthiae]|uniref:Phospholipase/carboxylesterase n=1 Tax=Hasllibacter halocynthiae TaxID=595589 RepID=A0A2T0X8F5_9RHOB|nr:alpha/beta fold hydrolase [Hasllibacter halocynthiae]PRY95228.1 phospholipase/carboxylesterase [Hasllibacter halocynthiae]